MGVWEEQVKRGAHHKKLWADAQEFTFIDALLNASNEEEVKAAYVREFALPVKTQERHDLVVDKVLFEFKYSVKLSEIDVAAKVVAQAVYYINRLYKKGRLGEIDYLVIADKDEGRLFRISEFQLFYESSQYQWDSFRPSAPDPELIKAIKHSKILESNRVYKLISQDDFHLFSSRLYRILSLQPHVNNPSSRLVQVCNLSRLKILVFSFVLILLSSGLAIGSKYYFFNDSTKSVPIHR